MQNRFKVLIFDLDGTLCETAQDIATSVNQTLMTLGYQPLPFEIIVRFIGDGIETLMRRALECAAGHSVWEDRSIEKIVARYKTYYDHNLLIKTKPYPAVTSTLERLKAKPLVVLSNKSYYFTRRILDHFGLSPYFANILGGDSLVQRKPHPLPLQFILSQYRIEPEAALFVGDSEKDFYAARAAAMPVCLVTYGMRSREELIKLEPEYLIDAIEELIEIVR